jgi:hypothetical protein
MANETVTESAEEYKIIRGQLEHIDNNLSQRVIWLVIAQSFFFSGYAVLLNGQPSKPDLMPIHTALEKIFPIAALLTVFFTCIDVVFSIRSMRDLRIYYEQSFARKEGDKSAKAFPPILGIPRQRIWMHASPVLLPLIFIITWIIILIVQYSGHGTLPPPPGQGH